MRWIIFILLALPACAQVDEARLLRAIALVESNGNPAAVGAHGERGECQMMSAMRRHYGTPEVMLRDLERQLPRAGMPVSEYTLALAFHCGMTRIRQRRITDADADYAQRVRAIYISP